MKKIIKPILLCAGLVPTLVNAQSVDRTKYPDYKAEIFPDYSLLKQGDAPQSKVTTNATSTALPAYVNNAELKFFPPVFNQDGGSCGSASRICYMFTHELNAFRNADAQLLSNRYPSHFVWLLTNGNSGKDEFVQFIGVPNAEVYGGTTYSSLFGNQDTSNDCFGWMQGYDKWYSAMWNRMLRPVNFPISVQTEEGRNAVKRWLYNHNGDTEFHGGGICGIGVASGGDWQKIPSTPANDEINVTNKYFVNSWGEQVDHALTIVGYDDRIEFDLNGDGVIGDKNADEVGAWIVVNSWSDGWCNKGFVYCPYKYGTPVGKGKGDYWTPEIYKVRKNYRPLRTIKLEMDYSRRSEICLSAGISTDLNADMPEETLTFDHFKYAGDGKNGNTQPAPEVPMLGRWADGKLHNEPMEFGYDLTDLSAKFDKNRPLKYFFIVEPRDWAEGSGKIHHASIIDYEFDKQGVETPFNLNAEGVTIQNKGNKTIISTIVYGEEYTAPLNLTLMGQQLTWNAPTASKHTLKGYKLYRNGVALAEIGADQKQFTLTENVHPATYSITAVYEGNAESAKVEVSTPIRHEANNQVVNFKHSGFSIPNIFTSKYNECTIEYWLKPNSIRNYNQSAGPGWYQFMFHTNDNGSFTAGWDTGNRINTPAGTLKVGVWTHIGIVVNKNNMKVFINGQQAGEVTTNSYVGIGGFGDLVFSSNQAQYDTDGSIDEIRIWNHAKDQSYFVQNKNLEISGDIRPKGLLAYYKGNVIQKDNKLMLEESLYGNHAEIHNTNFTQGQDAGLNLKASGEMTLSIIPPVGTIYVGQPATFGVNRSYSVCNLKWTADATDAKDLQTEEPTFVFNKAGQHTVTAVGSNFNGETTTQTYTANVEAVPAPDASFAITKSTISAGERTSFTVNHPMSGYLYEWNMPGATTTTGNSIKCATSYEQFGTYTITLKVTAPDGRTASSSQQVIVKEVAPATDFDITPATVVKGQTVVLRDRSKYTPTQWQWIVQSEKNTYKFNSQNASFAPNVPGIYSVELTASNNSGANISKRERALVVCNADSKNALNFTGNAYMQLTKVPFSSNSNATIEWWMKPSELSSACCGIGEEGTLMLTTTSNGETTLAMGTEKISTPAHFITAAEWHHYAISFDNGTVNFYRDGLLVSSAKAQATTLPQMTTFSFGHTKAPFLGQIDEFRVWNKTLTIEQLHAVANQPIENVANAVANDQLAVYYNFNQSSGNVKDLTGNGNEGIRMNFGPEGDAWGLSKGVFCLNFDQVALGVDVTATYLRNYIKPFKHNNQTVNPSNTSRFLAITDWTLENTVVKDNITTGVHVDTHKASALTYTAIWDGFDKLNDHKAYQTVTLPAGDYTFIANYDSYYEGNCGNSYLVVNEGKSLPNTANLNKAIASQKMVHKDFTKGNSLRFILTEEKEVSLGLLINLTSQSSCTFEEFKLFRKEIEEPVNSAIDVTTRTADNLHCALATFSAPYPTTPSIEGVKAYYVNATNGNNSVQLTEIAPNANTTLVVPANTGVLLQTETASTFSMGTTTETATNLDKNNLLQHTANGSVIVPDTENAYILSGDQEGAAFFKLSATDREIAAYRAYLVLPKQTNTTKMNISLDNLTGIDSIATENDNNAPVYDLSGRRVQQTVKNGVYIRNGKKLIIK